MALTIKVAHDFICPWCWIGLFQAQRMQREFGVKIDWRGYELFPKSLDWPEAGPSKEKPADKPDTPSRLALMLAAEGLEVPKIERPHHMRTYNTHQAVEYAKTEGVQDAAIEALYRAFWEGGRNINDPHVISDVLRGIVHDLDALAYAIKNDKFGDQVVDFDDDAYARGVYNVPTFFIGADRYAEQPYGILRKALVKAIENGSGTTLYEDIHFPAGYSTPGHGKRPYIFINMVSTIDGKIITGERDEPVDDLGSKTDHAVMHLLESKADAVLVGANSLRATPKSWNPKTHKRIVVTKSGNIPADAEFLHHGEPFVAVPGSANVQLPGKAAILRTGTNEVDWEMLLERLYSLGVRRLNVLGGSEINAALLERDLVDELFLTLAPKIKLGKDIPTYADGNPLPRHKVRSYDLVEHHAVEGEIFLRYRRKH